MRKYYLAIDIGASSGRHILAYFEEEKIIIEEVYRFENRMDSDEGRLYWDIDRLFNEVLEGMKACKNTGRIPTSVGIDTWGVDFVLIGTDGKKIYNPTAYRDKRTEGIDKEVYNYISEAYLYQRTGIQKQTFNSIYQLMAMKIKDKEILNQADKLLLIPDYLNYMLSGVMATEYTNATTMQLVDPVTKDWDKELIQMLGYPGRLFTDIYKPGSYLGGLLPEIAKEVGFDCKVILSVSHDTGSAIMAVPTNQENTIYISSGTWSLMGTELLEANCSDMSRYHNFTNEGGYDYRFRYLKNIMGLWMIQTVKKENGESLSYEDICNMASKSTVKSLVNCNDSRFLSPTSMTHEIQQACMETGQQIPYEVADVAAVIYNSLATCYGEVIKEIESVTGHCYNHIHIVGGGSNADYLNHLTAEITGRTVYAGPTEATSIGNVCCQMIAEGEIKDIAEARSIISRSFEIKKYKS